MSEETQPESAARKTARRRRVEGGRRTRHVVRVTPEEEGQLARLAALYHVSVPKLLVDSALAGGAQAAASSSSAREQLLLELFGAHRLLASIANNVNQLARVGNATKQVPLETDATLAAARRAAEKIDALVDELSEASS